MGATELKLKLRILIDILEDTPVLKRILIFFAVTCAITLACGEVPVACAGWPPPIVIPQHPRLDPPQPQPPQPLPRDYLEPTLKRVPPAPQVNTDNGQGVSAAGGGDGNSESVTTRVETAPQSTPPAVKEETPTPAPVETAAQAPATEHSSSKTPWLLVAGGVIAAFILGRRTK